MSLNFEQFIPYFFVKIACMLFMQLFLKILGGMANSIDPDQTAPLVTLVYKILGLQP